MFNYRDLKEQMEQLTTQNQTLSQGLQQLRDLLQHQSGGGDGAAQPANGAGSPMQQQQQPSGNSAVGNQQGSPGQNQANLNAGSGLTPVINDLLKLKQLTAQLESRMQAYISAQSSGRQLTQEDVVNLILHMMNGMIDWTMELESNQLKH